ncbi:helix-turn-helix domain-containing protein [Brevundimonas faecalis]|uniref:helix-turn-helix domain-containing protein n=1 Tax=Brevundimonas faecalis TaxID=947378 RepID=UPI003618A38D
MKDMRFARKGRDRQDPFHYLACGLDNVFLTSGYVRKQRAGQWSTAVEDADGLHDAIAEHLVLRRKRLHGKEVRFLRKHLELTQAELGKLLGVTDQTIARYEKNESAFDGAADMLLRVLVIGRACGALNPLEVVERIRASDDAALDELVLEHEGDGWRMAA